MDRREALRRIVIGSAGAAVVPAWVAGLGDAALARAGAAAQSAGGASAEWAPRVFTPHQSATVVELTELIIPRTETAGARDARVNEFIDTVLDDAAPAEREAFLSGLEWMDRRSRERFGVDFIDATPADRTALLTAVSSPDDRAQADREGVAFFEAVKRLTVTGYYTSEVGMLEELGDDGTLHFAEKRGCLHPEHKGQELAP